MRLLVPALAVFALWFAPLRLLAVNPNTPGEHLLELNGVRLWYKIAGVPRPGIAPMIHLPGGPGYNSYSFEKTIGPQLEQHVEMIYFDERGTGRSERPKNGDYAMSTLTADIEALRRSLGLPKLTVMGQSFGGTIALEYAARYPAHVQRLILVDAAADFPDAIELWATELQSREPGRWAAAMASPKGKALIDAEAHPGDRCALTKATFAVVWRVYGTPGMAQFHHWQQFHDQRYELQQGAWDKQSGLQNTGEFQNAYLHEGSSALCYRFTAYRKLTMPVLVIQGKYDGSVDPHQARVLAAHLPNARYDEFDASAHFPYAEQPFRFERDVAAFLQGQKAAPTPADRQAAQDNSASARLVGGAGVVDQEVEPTSARASAIVRPRSWAAPVTSAV